MDDNTNKKKGKEIDIVYLGTTLWGRRRFIIKALLIGLVIGIIIAFSIPKEYSTTVVFAPEGNNSSMGKLRDFAAMAGISLQSTTYDILTSPDLFPSIMESTPFIVGLFEVKVKDPAEGINTTFYNYVKDDLRTPWWDGIMNLPSKITNLFSSSKSHGSEGLEKEDLGVINLTMEEKIVASAIKGRVSIYVDKYNGLITLTSKMQNPVVSAYIADTVTSYLQSFIIEYRTQKARNDLLFTKKLYDEAKEEYYQKQQNLAAFIDQNLNVSSARYANTQTRLENEMALSYGVFNQMAQQLQLAQVKVQDTTPVYTIVEPAVVPDMASEPKKKTIIIIYLALALAISSAWVLLLDFYKSKKEVKKKTSLNS